MRTPAWAPGSTRARQVGVAAGIAALGAVFQSRVHDVLSEQLARAAPRLAARGHATADRVTSRDPRNALQALPPPLRVPAANARRNAFVSGFDRILWIAAAIAQGHREAHDQGRPGKHATVKIKAPGYRQLKKKIKLGRTASGLLVSG